MSLEEFGLGEKFIFRSKKHHVNNPDKYFWNTYEGVATSEGAISDLQQIANRIGNFEILLCAAQVIFDEVQISTWEPDSDPYDPMAHSKVLLQQTPGARSVAGGALQPLEMCLWIARDVTFGNKGKLMIRGALGTGDVGSPAGEPVLVDAEALQTTVNAALVGTNLSQNLAEGTAVVKLAMIPKDGLGYRIIEGFVVTGARTVNMNKKWYNRVTPPTP